MGGRTKGGKYKNLFKKNMKNGKKGKIQNIRKHKKKKIETRSKREEE